MFSDSTLSSTARAVVAGVEELEVEAPRAPGPPQPQQVDGAGAVAGDQGVVRLAEHLVAGQPAHPEPPLGVDGVLGAAAEADLDHVVGLRELPGVAVVEPGVRAARPASRPRTPGGRCRTRSGCRSRPPACSRVARESRKQAASRPRPPLPRPGSCLELDQLVEVEARARPAPGGRSPRCRWRAGSG